MSAGVLVVQPSWTEWGDRRPCGCPRDAALLRHLNRADDYPAYSVRLWGLDGDGGGNRTGQQVSASMEPESNACLADHPSSKPG